MWAWRSQPGAPRGCSGCRVLPRTSPLTGAGLGDRPGFSQSPFYCLRNCTPMSPSPPATPARTTIVALARDKVTDYKEQVAPGVSRAVLRGHHHPQPGGHLKSELGHPVLTSEPLPQMLVTEGLSLRSRGAGGGAPGIIKPPGVFQPLLLETKQRWSIPKTHRPWVVVTSDSRLCRRGRSCFVSIGAAVRHSLTRRGRRHGPCAAGRLGGGGRLPAVRRQSRSRRCRASGCLCGSRFSR